MNQGRGSAREVATGATATGVVGLLGLLSRPVVECLRKFRESRRDRVPYRAPRSPTGAPLGGEGPQGPPPQESLRQDPPPQGPPRRDPPSQDPPPREPLPPTRLPQEDPRRPARTRHGAGGEPGQQQGDVPPNGQGENRGRELVAGDDRTPAVRFPVLHTPSSAAVSPWLLPPEPSQPGISADEATLEGLDVRAASIVGPGHRLRGVARQDAYRIGLDRSGRYLLVAVADGMSDSRHSDIGAQVATMGIVDALRDALEIDADLRNLSRDRVLLAAAQRVHTAATQRNWDSNDVRSVAAAAVVELRAGPDGHRRVWLCALADAGAWRLRAGSWGKLIGDDKGGIDGGSVSHFLPYDPDAGKDRLVSLAPGDALAVVSDGVGDALASGPAAQHWFAQRWHRPPNVARFLLDVGFDQHQMHDDRTAVVVWSHGQEVQGW